MRLYLQLSKNKTIIPFNYQHLLTGVIHKWIGKENLEHGKMSLHSFSWFQNVDTTKNGINLKEGSYFFISAHKMELIKSIMAGILNDPQMFNSVSVTDVQITEAPRFEKVQKFYLASPAFIKRRENEKENHILFSDEKSGEYLTSTLKKRLEKAGISTDGFKVIFDKDYLSPKTKLIKYNQIENRANMCPVIIEGNEEQIAFAWNVGVGNSTGIGFGSLK